MERRHIIALVVVGAIIGFVAMPVLAAIFTNPASVSGGVHFEATDGPSLELTGDIDGDFTDPTPGNQSVVLQTTAGNLTARSDAPSELTIDTSDLTGSWTNVTEINATAADLEIDPEDKRSVNVTGSVSAVAFRDVVVDDRATDLVVSSSGGGVTVRGLPASETLLAVTAGGSLVDTFDTDSTGTGTIDTGSLSDAHVRIERPDAPQIDDSSASPQNQITEESVELSVDVSDADFATVDSEQLTVDWHLDGSQIDTTTLTRNATATKTVDITTGGSHTWSIEVTDSNGLTTSSATYSFESPSELRIYNESSPSQLVDGTNVSVEIRVFDDDEEATRVYERTTTDGTVSLAGLPIDGFTVVARADDYYFRRIYVSSLYEQRNVFLLPTSVAANYQVFTLDDRSGQYSPGQTRLEIQRALNQSGTLQWRTISGDQFGAANSYKTYLRDNKRYRLYVINEDGDRRLIGSYMSLDEVNPKQILVRDVRIEVPDGDSYSADAYVTDSDVLTFAYRDLADQTDELRLTIHERGNLSNVLEETTIAPVNGNWTYSRSLSGENANTSWIVDWSVDRSGKTHDGSIPVGTSGSMNVPMAGAWLQRFALLAIPVVAALASERIATYGALGAVAFAGMLMVFGWLQIHPMLWFAAATIAIGGHAWVISQRGGTVG